MSHQLITQNQFDDSLTQYGDGVFETMLAVGTRIHHWRYHWARLNNSCQRLAIVAPEREVLCQQLHTELVAQNNPFSVVKLLVSRGKGLRGYRSVPEQPCFVQFSITPHAFSQKLYQGLNVRVCQTRLAAQPLLAGMKHCNRLEYLLARREPDETLFDEGLLLDYDNQLIEGLISNVFLMKNQKIITPALDKAGVAGTMRAYLLEALPSKGYSMTEKPLSMADVADADAAFWSNATNGIMPIRYVQGMEKQYDISMAQAVQRLMEHPCSAQ